MTRFLALFALGAGLALGARPALAYELGAIKTYDRAQWSRTVTACDRLAAHPSDPERTAPGVAQRDMRLKEALKACRKAVAGDSDNPRLNYQLARAHGYAGLHKEGKPYRDKAVMAGYPQSLFVVGWIMVTGWDGAPKNVCDGAALMRLSARAGRLAGQVGYPHYASLGVFDGCPSERDPREMRAFLDAAAVQADDYYQRLLIDQLKARFAPSTTP